MTLPPQLRPHQHQRLSACHRHPTATPITGFCAACLRERLAGIQNQSPTVATSTTAQLRRSKSCSGGPIPSSASTSEPRRKSCDVRAHNTLHDLFAIDDRTRNTNLNLPPPNASEAEGFQDLEEEGESKTVKELIDLEWGNKKGSRRSFWDGASVFSKKLRKWRRKHDKKKEHNASLVPVEKPNVRRLRETQSEVGDYGFGRRSCDTDPRLSVDVGRLSVDDSRFSFDEPRASWDGYLIGKQNPRPTQMVSVGEDGNAAVSEERLSVVKEEERSPGGSAQTRDYYADSVGSHRRRKSLDRSGFNRRFSLGDADEVKSSISNAKVSPETVGLFHGAKLLVTEKELRDSNWYSLKDYGANNMESASKDADFVAAGVTEKGFNLKKSSRWKNIWNIWGLMPRRRESEFGDEKSGGGDVVRDETLAESLQKLRRVANGDEDRGLGGNVGDETLAESLQKLRSVANGDANGGVITHKLIRSCSVSARNPCKADGSFQGMSSAETRGDGEKRRDSFVLQQNRSARYSPNNIDNGLLRFYLTPLRSYRRSKSGKSRLKNSPSVGMRVL